MNRYFAVSILNICITVLIISLFAISKNYWVLLLILLYYGTGSTDESACSHGHRWDDCPDCRH